MKSHQILAIHILQAIERIELYTLGMSEQEFLENFLVQDGVMRNIEIIAEPAKKFHNSSKIPMLKYLEANKCYAK